MLRVFLYLKHLRWQSITGYPGKGIHTDLRLLLGIGCNSAASCILEGRETEGDKKRCCIFLANNISEFLCSFSAVEIFNFSM